MWYRNRTRGIYGFPWMLVFFLVFMTHIWQWLLLGFLLMIIMRLLMSSVFANGWNQQANQQPYYQPSQPNQQPYYTPTYEQQAYYQPRQSEEQAYERGYEAATPEYRSEGVYQAGQEQSMEAGYQEYEQPHAEYPQEMPPM